MLGPSAIRLRVQMGREERLGGRGGRAKACCDRGSGEDGFCRWVEGTEPRLPRLGARRSNRREGRLASSREQWWLGARWTMNASVLRSNKEFSSQLQETKQPVEKEAIEIVKPAQKPFVNAQLVVHSPASEPQAVQRPSLGQTSPGFSRVDRPQPTSCASPPSSLHAL